MRRKSRNHLIHVCLFFGALLFVLYLNLGGKSQQPFDWTTIRYKTTSTSIPQGHGECPGLSSTSKPALVVSRIRADDDPKWLDPIANKYHFCIYTNDASHSTGPSDAVLRVPANRGHEAMSYLTFIIDNYASIPAAGAAFIHGAQRAWHNDAPDYDNLDLLRDLNVSRALSFAGYHNLRCDWSAGTCDVDVNSPGSFETRLTALFEPFNQRAVSDAALPGVFATLFQRSSDETRAAGSKQGKIKLGNSDVLRAQCCAQFVVAREQIWQHSRDEYVAIRQWLLDDNAAPRDDRISGRILSYLWHVLFLPHKGEINVLDPATGLVDLGRLNALACPTAQECYCRLYGRCNLSNCPSDGHCDGQYAIPKDYRVPDSLLQHR